MKKKTKVKLIIKMCILIISLIIIAKGFNLALAKFETTSSSKANIDMAFYVLKQDFQTVKLSLGQLFPSDEPYVYKFSIANYDGEKLADVNITYDLTLKATTNLPISYELYQNQTHTDVGAVDIITNDETIQDEYGTYFRNMYTSTQNFTYTSKQKNEYELVINFPSRYNEINYQDIIEGVVLIIDAKQVI